MTNKTRKSRQTFTADQRLEYAKFMVIENYSDSTFTQIGNRDAA